MSAFVLMHVCALSPGISTLVKGVSVCYVFAKNKLTRLQLLRFVEVAPEGSSNRHRTGKLNILLIFEYKMPRGNFPKEVEFVESDI